MTIDKLCPYPGLRPFTVEESFFFKGRDKHVRQIINKLETNNILILTGASGDGKSSLIYAGLMPSAKAGFFRAKYNKWVFVDFRPERDPLKNLARSLATSLELEYESTLEELSYGFSSIIDLYKSSQFYIDESSNEWQILSAEDKKKRTLKASNLLILADQFEEFFTNSENYINGKATIDAYTTVNLLLETAKIANRDKLPIYVVCTLRSDFISQCIVFRGLPEAIGFSQFFVPRLNRTELQQVIEEPALLSGGKVSKRLKEILINELHDGFDQLPILQHTLKQLWCIAENGNQVLDMIHLAMVGGIHARFLTVEDKNVFNIWSGTISPDIKKYLDQPSSNNVLNAHADYLYHSAYRHYIDNISWGNKNITPDEAHLILKIAFQCLTKIDQGRSVRNRTNLEEITHIVDLPNVKYDTVCGVINIFRQQSITFLRPFIIENEFASQCLSFDTVLDITHESLIRNWEKLKLWNEEELANVSDFDDFKIQLDRWLSTEKSNDFLLGIGPLSHFENWYLRCKPNKYWLAKYDLKTSGYRERLRQTALLSDLCKEFLKSSRQFYLQSEKNKKRRRHLVLFAALAVILALSGFSYLAKKEKMNANHQQLEAEKQKTEAQKQANEAKLQQNLAFKANKIADKERIIAQKSAEQAMRSKAQSDSARKLAEKLKQLADIATSSAYKQADNARDEKRNAEAQRLNAEQQRKFADVARDSAKTLSYLSLSQSLSFKANQKYEDKQVNLLLALQSYNFNKKFNSNNIETFLYNSLLAVLKGNGFKNSIPISNTGFSACFFDTNRAFVLTNKGKLIEINFDMTSKKKEVQLIEDNIPINFAQFVSTQFLVVSLENHKNYLIDLKNNLKYIINGHNDFIRSTEISLKTKKLITSGRDQKILIFSFENNILKLEKDLAFKSKVSSICLTNDGKYAYISSNDGSIQKIDLVNYTITEFIKFKNAVSVIKLSDDNQILYAAKSNGLLEIIEIRTAKIKHTISANTCSARTIVFDPILNLLAISYDDKTIKLFDLSKKDHKSLNICDIDLKIIQIGFVNQKLYALLSNNELKFWALDLDTNAENVAKLIKRNLTLEEWGIYVGDRYIYEETLKK